MLKKISISTLFILACCQMAAAQDTWQKFTSSEGRFSVLVPTRPELTVDEHDTDQGKLKQYYYLSQVKVSAFGVIFADLIVADQRQIRLDNARDGLVAGMKAKLTSEKKIMLQGYPGRECTATATSEGIDWVIRARFFLVDKRLYQVVAVVPKQVFREDEAARFLDSFAFEAK